jgi:hypothetical protein
MQQVHLLQVSYNRNAGYFKWRGAKRHHDRNRWISSKIAGWRERFGVLYESARTARC